LIGGRGGGAGFGSSDRGKTNNILKFLEVSLYFILENRGGGGTGDNSKFHFLVFERHILLSLLYLDCFNWCVYLYFQYSYCFSIHLFVAINRAIDLVSVRNPKNLVVRR
jgi:hypothetical protein